MCVYSKAYLNLIPRYHLIILRVLDRSVTLINAVEGRKRKTIHSQKYGCGVIRYTHHDQVIFLLRAHIVARARLPRGSITACPVRVRSCHLVRLHVFPCANCCCGSA